MAQLMETLRFAKGIDPVADAFAGANVRSDVFRLGEYQRGLFVIHVGVGATGSSTIIVNSCDAATPATRTAIPYWSREIVTGDTEGAITRRAAAGYVYTVGSSKIILIEVAATDLVDGHEFVELELDESVDSPVLAGVLFIGGGGRYQSQTKRSILA